MPGSQILLLNPRRRRRRLSNPRRARRAHSRRAHRRTYHRRANPRRVHRVAGHYARSKRGRRFYVRAHRSNPRMRRRRRSNPRLFSSSGGVMRDYVMPAAIGAAGAVALKIGWGYLSPKLPTMLQSGWGAMGGQAAVVLAAGYGLGRVMPRQRRQIGLGVVGALTVIAYSAAVQLLSSYVPQLQGLRDYVDYAGNMGAYMGPGAVALPAPAAARMGVVSPAPALRGLNAYMTY